LYSVAAVAEFAEIIFDVRLAQHRRFGAVILLFLQSTIEMQMGMTE
jgi:hypothetical protein